MISKALLPSTSTACTWRSRRIGLRFATEFIHSGSGGKNCSSGARNRPQLQLLVVSLHVKASKCEPSLPEEISHVIRKAGTVEKDLLQSAPPRIRNLDLPPQYPMKCRLR